VQEARALIGPKGGPAAGSPQPGAGAPAPAGAAETAATTAADPQPSVLALGAELIQRVFEPKAEREQGRSALGVPPSAEPAIPAVPYKVMNPTPAAAAQAEPAPASAAPATPPASPPPASLTPASTAPARAAAVDTATNAVAAPAAPKATAADKPAADKPATERASAEKARFAVAGAAAMGAAKAKPLPDTALPPAANQKCRVWTASYGGQKSIIIRSIVDQVVNFTVLDVNSGQETREAEAFIAAYAKNGKIAGEYPNQAQALDKAFELCPEG
jgi:hypothetical protein